jgi:hypothetical protein
MTSVISNLNNTNQPILALQTFGGKFELVNAYTALSFAITTDTNCLITVYQSYDGVSLDSVSAFSSVAGVFFSKQINLLYKYCRISVYNFTGVAQTYISFMTRWMSVIPLPLENLTVNIDDNSLPLPVIQTSSSVVSNISVNQISTVIKAGTGSLAGLYIQSNNLIPSAINYLKIYPSNTGVAGDVPLMIISVLAGSSQNINTYNLGISSIGMSMRATNLLDDGDNTPPTNTISVQAFIL